MNRRKHSKEVDKEVLALWNQGSCTRKQIAERFGGMKESYVKTLLSKNKDRVLVQRYERQLINLIQGSGYKVLETYQTAKTKLSFECPVGHTFKMTPNNFTNGARCPECFKLRRSDPKPNLATYTFNDAIESCTKYQFKFVNPPEDLSQKMSDGVNKKEGWNIQCHCGRFFHPSLHDIRSGKCISCGCIKSKAPLEIAKFIEEFGISVKINDRSIITPYEIDILLPELKIGIEYCGLYWHGEKFRPHIARNRHWDKWQKCKEQGYRLITIFEDEWTFGQERVLGFLRAILQKNSIKIGARECKILPVDSAMAKDFLNQNHIQGAATGNHLGLFFQEGLVSLLTTRPAQGKKIPEGFSKDAAIDIVRFCNKIGTTIAGGFTKLLEGFIKINPQVGCFITYADNRWSNGGLYRAAGFTESIVSGATYSYYKKNGEREHRFNYRKEKIAGLFPEVDLKRTEWDIMQSKGYDRIWDCGKTKWVKILSKSP